MGQTTFYTSYLCPHCTKQSHIAGLLQVRHLASQVRVQQVCVKESGKISYLIQSCQSSERTELTLTLTLTFAP